MEVHPEFETKLLAQCEKGELILIETGEEIRLCILIGQEPSKSLLLILDRDNGPISKEYRNSLDCISYRKDFKIMLSQDRNLIKRSTERVNGQIKSIHGAIAVSSRYSVKSIYMGIKDGPELKDETVMIHPEVKFDTNHDNWWFLEWRLVLPKLNKDEEVTLFSFKAREPAQA